VGRGDAPNAVRRLPVTNRKTALCIALVVAASLVVLAVVPTAVAGKGGKPGRGGGGPKATYTGTMIMENLDSTDGLDHYGQRVKFTVVTNAPWPFVDVDCTQGAGELVYHSTVGYYGGWPWDDVFTLSGWAWPGGEADCTAKLYNSDGSTTTTVATLHFHVYE
jgi:hypothetical protein